MATPTYYPSTNDGRANWWKNIQDNGTPTLTALGFSAADVAAIILDASWAVYAYGTVRRVYNEFTRALTAYADAILHGTPDGSLPAPPVVPTFPTAPHVVVDADVESRRERWVQEAKNKKGYNLALGQALGIEASASEFREDSYQCQMLGVHATSAHTVSGKFRKASGRVEGINLHGRPTGTMAWQFLGRFTATPFPASVPLTGAGPQAWEFQASAVRRDEEFGLPSDIQEVLVRP